MHYTYTYSVYTRCTSQRVSFTYRTPCARVYVKHHHGRPTTDMRKFLPSLPYLLLARPRTLAHLPFRTSEINYGSCRYHLRRHEHVFIPLVLYGRSIHTLVHTSQDFIDSKLLHPFHSCVVACAHMFSCSSQFTIQTPVRSITALLFTFVSSQINC